MTASMQPAMASQMMTSKTISHQGDFSNVAPLTSPLPAGRVNAAITRMLNGARLASALWAEKSVPPRRRSGGGADAHAHLTPGVQAIVGASRRGTSGLAVGTSPRDRLLQRYAERSYPTLEDAGVPGSASPRGVSMRRKSELTSRRLQAYLVDEVADDLREELGLLPPGGVVDSGQFGLRPGGRGLTGSGGGGGQWRKGKALSMSDLSQSRADSLTHNHHSHTQEDIPITIVNGNLTKAASTNDPERLNHKGSSGSGGMDTPERASSLLKTPGGKGSGGGVGGVGEGRTRRRRGEGPGNRSVTNNNKASSSQPTLPPPPPLSETPPPGEQPPPPPPPPQSPARLPSQPQDQIVTPLIFPPPPNTRDIHITPVSSQEETSSQRLRTRPSTSPDEVAKISRAHVNFGTMDDDVLSRSSSYGSNRRRPPPTIAPPPPPDKATEGSTMAPSDWRASSPQTQRMPISGSLSRTAEMIRDRRIPPMPSGPPPPPPPTAVSDDRLMVVGDPEGEVDETPGQPEDNLIPVEEPEQVDLDVIPDGINRKHLPMLRDKRVFEKQLAARLEHRLESEDQLLGDLRQCMELPTMRQKVETTMQVITDVIRTSIVADRAAGRRVYSVLVDLGNFHRHVTHHVDGHVVSVEGTTFGDPDTALTKELLIEFPESVVMEQLKVRQVGPTIELDVPFKPSEFMTDLTRVVNKMDADAEEGKGEENRKRKETNMAADDDGVGSVLSDQTLSVLSDPNDLGDPDDLHLPDLPISPPPPTPAGKEPKPMRRRRKFTKTGSSKQTESPSSPMSNGNALHTDISHAKASIGKSLSTGKSNSTMSNGDNKQTGSSHSSSSHSSSSHSSITNGTSFNKDTGYEAFRKSFVESQTSDSVTNDKTESSNSIDSLYGSDDMDFVEENRPHHKATYHSVRPNPFEADVKTESKVEMDEDFVTIRHVPFEKKASHSEIQKGKLTEQKLPHTQPNTSTFTQSIKGVEITDPVQVATVMDGQPLDNDSKPTSSRVTSITLQSSLQPTKPSHKTHRSRKIKVRKMSNPDYESVITVSNERVNSETDHAKMDRRKSDSPQHAIVDDWISIDCDDKDVSYDEGHSRGRLDEVGSNISSNTYSVSEYTIDEGESGISVQTRNDEEDMSEGGLVFEESLSPSASQGNSSTRIDKAVTPEPVFTPEPVNILTVTAVTGDQLSQSVKDVTVTIEEDRDEPLGSSSPNVLTHPNPPRHGLGEKSNNMEKCDPAVLSDQANIIETGNQSVTDSKLGNLQPGPTELACDFESHQVHSSSDKMYQNVKGIQHKSVTTIDTNQANQGNHSEPTVSGLSTSHTKINHTRSNYREADIQIDDTPVKELKHSEASTTVEGMSKQSEIKIAVEPDTPKAAIHEEEHLAPSEMGQNDEQERYNIQDNTENTSDRDQDSGPAIYVRPKRPKDRLGEGRDKESKGKEIEETKEDASESVYVRPKRPNKYKSESLHLEPLHLEEVEVYVRPKRSNREGKRSELSLKPDTSDHSEDGRHRKGRQDGLSEREFSHVEDSTDIEPHVGKDNQESLTERGICAITDSRFRRSNLDGANPQNIKGSSVHITTPGMVKKEGLGKVQVHSLNTSDTSHFESENRDGKRTLSQSKSQRDDSRIKVNPNEGKSPEWGRVLRRHPVDRRVDKAGQKPWDRQKRLSLDGRKSANMDKALSDKKPGGLTKAELIGEDERVGKLRQMFENLGQGKKSVQSNTGLRKVKVKPSKSDERTPVDNQTPIYV